MIIVKNNNFKSKLKNISFFNVYKKISVLFTCFAPLIIFKYPFFYIFV